MTTIAERHRELAAALDRVRGAVELSVRALGERPAEEPADSGPSSGTDYLRTKARAAAAREGALRAVHEPLARRARATKQRSAREANELMRVAYLGDRAAVDGFVDLVSELQAANPHVRLLCTGPWPPYSFTEQ